MPQETQQGRPSYRSWLRGTLVFLALLVVVRFVLEISGVPSSVTRSLSSSAAVFLAAIYLGAVAPLRGVTKYAQLMLPSVAVAAWTEGWIILVTMVSAVFRLARSHFAYAGDYGNWAHLWRHVSGHIQDIVIFSPVVIVLMAVTFLLRRWPVTVGPGAMLGALVIVRFWLDAVGAPPTVAAAASSTVGVLACGFYLGGVGPRLALTSVRQLFLPSIIIGWVWRFWVFVASALSAVFPFYKTHFFDPTDGRALVRLAQLLGLSFLEGFVFGLVLWGIAVWISRATRLAPAA